MSCNFEPRLQLLRIQGIKLCLQMKMHCLLLQLSQTLLRQPRDNHPMETAGLAFKVNSMMSTCRHSDIGGQGHASVLSATIIMCATHAGQLIEPSKHAGTAKTQ